MLEPVSREKAVLSILSSLSGENAVVDHSVALDIDHPELMFFWRKKELLGHLKIRCFQLSPSVCFLFHFLLSDSPLRSIRWAPWTILSRTASATVKATQAYTRLFIRQPFSRSIVWLAPDRQCRVDLGREGGLWRIRSAFAFFWIGYQKGIRWWFAGGMPDGDGCLKCQGNRFLRRFILIFMINWKCWFLFD